MTRRKIWTVALLLFCITVAAQGELRKSLVDRISECVAFVQHQESSGNALVVAKRGDTLYCVTALNVVGGLGSECTVHLMTGTPRAEELTAKVVRIDRMQRVAMLRMKSKLSPRLFRLRTAPLPDRNDQVYRFDIIAPSEQDEPTKPSPTRSGVDQRESHRNGYEHLRMRTTYRQMPAGAPLVNEKGELLGLISSTSDDEPVLVPTNAIVESLKGDVHSYTVSYTGKSGSADVFEVRVELVDPLKQINQLSALVAPAARQTGSDWRKPMRNARTSKLRLRDDVATGTVRMTGDDDYLIQLRMRRGTEVTCPHRTTLRECSMVRQGWQFRLRPAPQAPASQPQAPVAKAPPTTAPTQPKPTPKPKPKPKPKSEPAAKNTPVIKPRPLRPYQLPADPDVFIAERRPLSEPMMIPLPERVVDSHLAGGGRLFVLKLRATPALFVVDLLDAEVIHQIPTPPGGIAWGAGGNRAVVLSQPEDTLHSFDLTTGEQIKVIPSPFERPIAQIIMGRSRSNVAMVRSQPANLGPPICHLIDTETLELLPLDPSAIRSAHIQVPSVMRANADLTHVGEWNRGAPKLSYQAMQWGLGEYTTVRMSGQQGYLLPGEDGRIYTSSGRVLNADGSLHGEVVGADLLPDLDGVWCLSLLRDGTLSLHDAETLKIVKQLGVFQKAHSRMPTYRHFAAATSFGRIGFLPGNKTLEIHPFDFKTFRLATRPDFVVVEGRPQREAVVGEQWIYPIRAISSDRRLHYKLLTCPPGMRVNMNGVVVWTRTETASAPVTAIVQITNQAGQATRHKFNVPLAETPDEEQTDGAAADAAPAEAEADAAATGD